MVIYHLAPNLPNIHWYTLFFIGATFLGYYLIRKKAKNFLVLTTDIDNLFLTVVPLGIIGARWYHVVDKWSYYQHHLSQIFYLWQGGLGIFGGLAFGFMALWFYCLIKKLPILSLLDLILPYVLLGQAIGRIGNFFNSEGFGPPTSLPWKVFIPTEKRPQEFKNYQYFHPTFFYEAILDLIGFLLLLLLSKSKPKKGVLTAGYLIIYGSGRLAVEFFRLDTAKIGAWKIGYFISLGLVSFGLFLFVKFTTMITKDKRS